MHLQLVFGRIVSLHGVSPLLGAISCIFTCCNTFNLEECLGMHASSKHLIHLPARARQNNPTTSPAWKAPQVLRTFSRVSSGSHWHILGWFGFEAWHTAVLRFDSYRRYMAMCKHASAETTPQAALRILPCLPLCSSDSSGTATAEKIGWWPSRALTGSYSP